MGYHAWATCVCNLAKGLACTTVATPVPTVLLPTRAGRLAARGCICSKARTSAITSAVSDLALRDASNARTRREFTGLTTTRRRGETGREGGEELRLRRGAADRAVRERPTEESKEAPQSRSNASRASAVSASCRPVNGAASGVASVRARARVSGDRVGAAFVEVPHPILAL
mmetsp:Transcript_35387/g.109161  ORF Transcript_35387/g.109161 Transcript_35387/m.109161 type:complete len:172 (-) Transcript_35387:95-610(-)